MKFLNKIDGADKLVTSDAQQFISKAEKEKLTGIQAGALNNPHPATHPASMITESTIKRFVSDAEKAEWNSKSIKNIGTFNSHEELIMYAITEQIPTGQYAFFMGDAGHASLALVRDAGTYYEGMTQGSDGLYVIFDVTKQGQMREYGELYARDIIASFDDIKSIFFQLDDKVDNSRVLTDVPSGAKFTDTITTINGKTGAISKADIVALGIPSQDTNTTYAEITTAEIDAGTASTGRTITGRRVKYILDKASSMISVAVGALTKSSVGLGNVDNTSDLNKPISNTTQAALDTKRNTNHVFTWGNLKGL